LIAAVTQGSVDGDTITLNPIKDTFIASDEENSNYGDSKHIEVYYYYEPWEYIEDNETHYALEDYCYIYVMFDLFDVPSNFVVDHASLRLYSWMVVDPVDIGTFLSPDNTWSEIAMTWKNAPEALPDMSDNVHVSAEDAFYSWDVTDFAKTAFGVYNLTIALKPTMSGEGLGYVFFSAKEDTDNSPQLIIIGKYVTGGDPSQKPDLTVADIIWSPTDPKENEQIAFQACIENFGNAPSLSTFRVNFYVDDSYVAYSEVGAMDVMYTIKSYPIVVHPLFAGTHFIKAIVDPTKIVDESNEQNNELQRQIVVTTTPEETVVQNGPDLRITGVTWEPQNPSYEDQMRFYVHVENCGNEPSVPIFDVEVWVDGAYQGRAQLGTIEIGQTKISNPIVTYPLSEGIRTVRAIVDSKNSVFETNETNNMYEIEINVIPEFPSTAILLVFAVVTLIVVSLTRRTLPRKIPEDSSIYLSKKRLHSSLRLFASILGIRLSM
jgi:hypothetical protein